jgi:hypothetical protein
MDPESLIVPTQMAEQSLEKPEVLIQVPMLYGFLRQ